MKFIKNLVISIFCTGIILFFKLDDILIRYFNINKLPFYIEIGGVFIVYLALFLMLCILIDIFYILVVISLIKKIEILLAKKLLTKQKWKRRVIFIIRTTYTINKFFYIFRPGIVRYGYNKENDIWVEITKYTISERVASLVKVCLNLNFIVIIFLTAEKLSFIDVNFKVIKEIINQFLAIKVDMKSVFSSMPMIVALVTLIPSVFFFYFYSDKAEVRKLVEESEQEKRKNEVIFLKLLLIEIWSAIYEISVNLENITNRKELVIDLILNSKLSNFSEFNNKFSKNPMLRNLGNNLFRDIEKLEKISCLINENENTRFIFAWKYEINEFTDNLSEFKNSIHINKVFYTKKGMESIIEENEKDKISCCDKKDYDELRKDEKEKFAEKLYNAYELLYIMYRFCIFVDSILYQSKNEKIVKKIFSKSK